jgi:hypothetical protein
MTKRLTPYGLTDYSDTVSKVGKSKAVPRLAARMPSPEIVAKVGNAGVHGVYANRTHRLVRLNAHTAGPKTAPENAPKIAPMAAPKG